MLRKLLVAGTVASTLLLSACGDSDDTTVGSDRAASTENEGGGNANGAVQNSKSAVDVALDTPELSILVEAVVAADLVETLSGVGPFTIFAPTNNAFVNLLGELGITKDALLADKSLLTSVLTYHVLDGEVKAADVPVGQVISPLGGSVFKIDRAGNGLTITDGRNRNASIIATDVMADNGVIHLIDQVILPANKTVVQTASEDPEFSILVEAVVAAGLVDTLSGEGPFTVFAPTNGAFADLLGELGVSKEALLADTDLLTSVLTYHAVAGQVLRANVPLDEPISTVQGGAFSVNSNLAITDGRGRMANIVATDILNTNGVIHVIDRVILPSTDTVEPPVVPSRTIVDIAQSDSNFSILVEALAAADLVDLLTGVGPFTVFAPTNAAFADLLAELHVSKETLLNDPQLLTDVLLYHVLNTKVLAAEVPLGAPIATVRGGNISINDHFQINDNRHRQTRITTTDIMADNGVIHVIDGVLLPY